jgi:TetR/AcrR family transcriptional regulator, transcriptional repressor for nem operon
VRVTRKQSEANREKVLDVAGTLFRERGFDGIGVADIMKRAGLTHGGFYGQFVSKDDLAAEATARVLGNRVAGTADGKSEPIIRRRGPGLPVAPSSRRSRNGLFDSRAWIGRHASTAGSPSRPHRWVSRPA